MDILKLELLFTQKFKIIKQIKTPYKVFMFFLPHLPASPGVPLVWFRVCPLTMLPIINCKSSTAYDF